MCLILFAYKSHPKYSLILAANRDEFYKRPTLPISFWKDAPHVLAGRDLKGMGTWLGLTRKGRITAITNYRDPASHKPDTPSRGALVKNFLVGNQTPKHYLNEIKDIGHKYNGFNLLVGDHNSLWYTSNRLQEKIELGPGLYGLSNHLLDTPWPKTQKGKAALQNLLEKNNSNMIDALFTILEDKTRPSDHSLPDTGIGLEWERILSPVFITSGDYGTRSSSVILIDNNGRATFAERSFMPDKYQAFKQKTRHFQFTIAI